MGSIDILPDILQDFTHFCLFYFIYYFFYKAADRLKVYGFLQFISSDASEISEDFFRCYFTIPLVFSKLEVKN